MIKFVLSLQQAVSLFLNSIISIIKVVFLSKFSVRKLSAGNPYCGILGNGPSLKISLERDIEFIKKLELFAVNLFAVTDTYIDLKPKNYLILDMAFLNPAHSCQEGLTAIVNNTTWEMNLYVPYQMMKSDFFLNRFIANPHIRLIPYNYTIVTGYRWLTYWFFRNSLGMPQCQNVLVAALFYAINMGFKEIYLFGADQSWHEMIKLDENNNMVVSDSHFYQHKDIDISVRENSYMSQQLFSLHKAFYGYEVLGKYAKAIGIKIYNASARSYIDVFEKVNLKDSIK